MSLERLREIRPGAIGIFAGALTQQPATVQRRLVRAIEKLGFGTLWCGETVGREVFAQVAIMLAASSELVIGSGIASIYARDPQAMANGARALAEAWPGRFILGLGVSHDVSVAARGHRYGPPVATMRRYLEDIGRAAWRGPDVEIPPIVLAALGPKMAGLAADRTAGVYCYFTTTEHVSGLRKQLGPEPFLAADLPVILARDRNRARQIGERHMAIYLRFDNYRNNLARLGWTEGDLEVPGSDRLFDSIIAWGDVEEIRSRIAARFEAGADQVVLNPITEDPTQPYTNELKHLAGLGPGVVR